jgi:hypothetical protein
MDFVLLMSEVPLNIAKLKKVLLEIISYIQLSTANMKFTQVIPYLQSYVVIKRVSEIKRTSLYYVILKDFLHDVSNLSAFVYLTE